MGKYVIFLLIYLFLAASVDAQNCSGKKGIGTWTNPRSSNRWLDSLNLSWYYNWDIVPPSDYKGNLEFIPMIWGDYDHYTSDATFNFIKSRDFPALLGFNESDQKGQADMSVSRAIELWPKLESTGKRLGSPAMAGTAYQENSWLDQFMDIAGVKGYRVDFICVHIYQKSFDVNHVLDYCRKTYEKYHRPVWITEWSLANWEATTVDDQATMEEQSRYLIRVIKALDSLEYVERHAWFAMWDGHYTGNPWPMYMVNENSEKYTITGEAMKYVCETNSFYIKGNLLFNPGFEVPRTGRISGNWDIIPGWNSDEDPVNSGIDSGDKATEGSGYGFLMAGDPAVWQLTDHVIKGDQLFTLTFDAFNIYNGPEMIVSLFCPDKNGKRILLASDTIINTGTGSEYSVWSKKLVFKSPDAPPEAIGRRIGVEVSCPVNDSSNASGSLVGFDNFKLSFVKLDIIPPKIPKGLTAVPEADSISLDWTDNKEVDFAFYNIYRSETSGTDYNLVASGMVMSNYLDHNLIEGTTYYYMITAVDKTGNESGFSTEVSSSATTVNQKLSTRNNRIFIYPNPFYQGFEVFIPDNQFNIIEINSMDGTQVFKKEINPGSDSYINLEKIGAGIYILKIMSDINTQSLKIIKL